MINKCKSCNFHRYDNTEMRSYGKLVIDGDYCLKYAWNLTNMHAVPKNCHT